MLKRTLFPPTLGSPASYCWLQHPGLGASGTPPFVPPPPHRAAEGQEMGSSLVPAARCVLHALRWGQSASPPAESCKFSYHPALRCFSAGGKCGMGLQKCSLPISAWADALWWCSWPSILLGQVPHGGGSGGSSAVEICVYLCMLADHICLRRTALSGLSKRQGRCLGHPSSVQLDARQWLLQPPQSPHCSWTETGQVT